MLELYPPLQESLNTKDIIRIDLIKDCQEFLENFEINRGVLLDALSITHRYLKIIGKIPHNPYKVVIAAYYIALRHPLAFPVHEPKSKFCKKFGLKQSSLEYNIEKIIKALKLIRILDDRNFPYYIVPKNDLGYNVMKKIVKMEVEKKHMNFLLSNRPINSQILSEELVNKVIFEMKIFPEELFRQFYEIIYDLVEEELQDYNTYINVQRNIFI
ncbi:MAG: hypothetical protein ACTSPD_13650 [Promethearchaeota archaeon]